MSASLHHRLREATAEAHGALERDLDWRQRIETLEGYRSLLARLRGFHAVYEAAIGAALSDEVFFKPRRRLDRLDRDLRDLGLARDAVEALPGPARPMLRDGPEAFGSLYVLEGSTLGGTVIGRAIIRRHGFDARNGASYYEGHGRATASMWKAFLARLETLSDDGPAGDGVVEKAVETFAAMRLWLTAAADRTGSRRDGHHRRA